MSEMSKETRKASREKAHRMAFADPHQKVDASDWTPPEPLNTTAKTGLRPVSRQARRRGGKVGMHAHGEMSAHRADRKPRKSGGSANAYVNRDVKEANAEAFGKPHDGGYKKGGRTAKMIGGPTGMPNPTMVVPASRMAFGQRQGTPLPLKTGGHADEAADKALIRKMVKSSDLKPKARAAGGKAKWIQDAVKHPGALHREMHVPEGHKIPEKKLEKAAHSDNPKLAKRARLAETLKRMHHADGGEVKGANSTGGSRPTGGRIARKEGGRAGKGKMNVNIVIAQPKPEMQPPMAPPAMPPRPAAPIPVSTPMPAMPPAGMGAPAMPPMGAAPPPAMPRKRGGRTYRSYKDMDAGSLGGMGRLEKVEIQQHKR
jgi:hypothetical protein